MLQGRQSMSRAAGCRRAPGARPRAREVRLELGRLGEQAAHVGGGVGRPLVRVLQRPATHDVPDDARRRVRLDAQRVAVRRGHAVACAHPPAYFGGPDALFKH